MSARCGRVKLDQDQIVDFWRDQGVRDPKHLDKVVMLTKTRHPFSNLERIEDRLKQLRHIIPGVGVTKVVSYAPNLLVYDIESSIPPKIAALERLLPGMDVRKVVANSPQLLTFDIEGNIGPKIRQLQALLPGALGSAVQSKRL